MQLTNAQAAAIYAKLPPNDVAEVTILDSDSCWIRIVILHDPSATDPNDLFEHFDNVDDDNIRITASRIPYMRN